MGTLKLYFEPVVKTKSIKKTSSSCNITTETQKEYSAPYNCEAGDQMLLTLKEPSKTTNGTGFILASVEVRTYENGNYVYHLSFDSNLINVSGLTQCDILDQCCLNCDIIGYLTSLFAAGDISSLIEVGTFTPESYDGNGSLDWAVTPTDNRFVRFKPRFTIGSNLCQLVWLSFTGVGGTTSGTTNNQLRVILDPDQIELIADNTVLAAQGQANGAFVGAFAITKAADNEIHGYKSDGSNWGVTANTGFNFSGFVIAKAA